MKNKIFIGILLVIIVFLIFLLKDNKKYYSDNIDYFYDVYNQIRGENFYVAKIESDTILLKNKDFNIIKEIKIKSKKKRVKVISVLKEYDQIYFAISGSVDDSEGILFTDKNVVDMQGLYSLYRIGGNSYYYRTYP